MTKHELQRIILSGSGEIAKGKLIETTAHYLRRSKEASDQTKGVEYDKDQEAKILVDYINKNDLWYKYPINENIKIGEGAEQKVYFDRTNNTVIKVSDSVYYLYWLDYLNNLLLHNHFFPATFYELKGFISISGMLHAVVEQPYIKATEPLNLQASRQFLEEKGFINKKNCDYYNRELGIILEDLHDENILQNNGVQFFIDTVFYLSYAFYNS